MRTRNPPKDKLIRIGANYACPRCGGRGWLYLADPDVKEVKEKRIK